MTGRSFHDLMGSPDLAKLNQLARAQRQLDAKWQAIVPPELAGQTRVVGVDTMCLVISTRSPAVMSKIRQMEVRLVAQLIETGLKVNSIRCRVQVETLPHERKNPKRNLTLSAAALTALDDAAKRLPASPLQEALANLVAKRRR